VELLISGLEVRVLPGSPNFPFCSFFSANWLLPPLKILPPRGEMSSPRTSFTVCPKTSFTVRWIVGLSSRTRVAQKKNTSRRSSALTTCTDSPDNALLIRRFWSLMSSFPWLSTFCTQAPWGYSQRGGLGGHIALGLAANVWPEFASPVPCADAHGYIPSGKHPAILAPFAAAARVWPTLAVANRGNALLSPAFADAEDHCTASG